MTTRVDELLMDPEKQHIRVDLDYLTGGAEVLIACRRLLKNTYPFAFFLRRGTNPKELFEHLQGRLESVTETLAGLLEAEGEPCKLEIIATTADARTRIKNMRELLENSPDEPEEWK